MLAKSRVSTMLRPLASAQRMRSQAHNLYAFTTTKRYDHQQQTTMTDAEKQSTLKSMLQKMFSLREESIPIQPAEAAAEGQQSEEDAMPILSPNGKYVANVASRIVPLDPAQAAQAPKAPPPPPESIALNAEPEDFSKPLQRIVLPQMTEVVPKVHVRQDDDVRVTTIQTRHGPLRVASVENHNKMSTVQIMFEAGIRYEDKEKNEHGLSIVLNKLSFKRSKNFDEERLAKLHDKIIYESTVEHEHIQYTCEFYRERLPMAMELLADTICRPELSQDEIEQVLDGIELSWNEQHANPAHNSILTDYILESAFGTSQGLGKSSLVVNRSVTRESLRRYMQKFFTPERAVIVGVGVDHEEFVALVKKNLDFEHLDSLSDEQRLQMRVANRQQTRWQGTAKTLEFTEPPEDIFKMDLPSLTAFVVSFQGCSFHDPDIYAFHVLETMLGGGNAFSAGGPGKGLLSLINNYYLPRYQFYNMMAQHQSFSDTGLFCLHASDGHENAHMLLQGIVDLLEHVGTTVNEQDLARAKNRFTSQLLVGIEDNISLATNLAADLLFLGHARGSKHFMDQIQRVTMQDIRRVLLRILSSRPAVACIGRTEWLPPKENLDDYVVKLKGAYETHFAKQPKHE